MEAPQPNDHNTAATYLILTIFAAGLDYVTKSNVTFLLSIAVSFMALRYYYVATKKMKK